MLVKVLLITKLDSDAELIKQQLILWYGDGIQLKRVRSIKEGFDELEIASRIQQEYDRIFWTPDHSETQHVDALQKSFPTANISLISSENISVGIRAYAQTQHWEMINLNREMNRLREVLDYEVRRKSSGTERIQLNRELATLEATVLQLSKKIPEIEKFLRDQGERIVGLVEKDNLLLFQLDQLSKQLGLIQANLNILEKDQLLLEDRTRDLEEIAQPGKGDDERGKDAGQFLAILLAVIGVIGTFLPAFFTSTSPSINKIIEKTFGLDKETPPSLTQPQKEKRREGGKEKIRMGRF
jgi:hypothetical protein